MPGQMATARLDRDVMISNIGPVAENLHEERKYVCWSECEREVHTCTDIRTHTHVRTQVAMSDDSHVI